MAVRASPPTDFGSRSTAPIQILTILPKLLLNTSLAVTSKIIPFQASFPSKSFTFHIFCLKQISLRKKHRVVIKSSVEASSFWSPVLSPPNFPRCYCAGWGVSVSVAEHVKWNRVDASHLWYLCYKAYCIMLLCALTFFGMLIVLFSLVMAHCVQCCVDKSHLAKSRPAPPDWQTFLNSFRFFLQNFQLSIYCRTGWVSIVSWLRQPSSFPHLSSASVENSPKVATHPSSP